jgi:hypothetical protein
VKCYVWSIALYGAETWTIRTVDLSPQGRKPQDGVFALDVKPKARTIYSPLVFWAAESGEPESPWGLKKKKKHSQYNIKTTK